MEMKNPPHPGELIGDVVYMSGNIMSTGTAAKYNSTFTDNGSSSLWSGGWTIASTPTTTSFTFTATSGQNNSDAGGAPGITDFGWLCSASMVQINDTSSPRDSRSRVAPALCGGGSVSDPCEISTNDS